MKQNILALLLVSLSCYTCYSQNDTLGYQTDNQLVTKIQLVQSDLKIYPNPVKNKKITLELNSGQITEIHLVSLVGKEVAKKQFEFGVQKFQMQLEEIPKGIYLIQVKTDENKTVVKKLLVQGN